MMHVCNLLVFCVGHIIKIYVFTKLYSV